MSNYTKSTNFATKDNLAAGNALKRVKGAEIDDEFNALATAVATKANLNNTTLTGTPTAPTASAAINSTQLATTAYVTTAVAAIAAAEVNGYAYPVGSIYTAVVATNPATLLGVGVWAAFGAGRVVLGHGGGYTAGNTGGATTDSHTLTTTEIPSHNHDFRVFQGGNGYTNTWGYPQSVTNGGDRPVTSTYNTTTTHLVQPEGGGGAHTHDIVQPYIVVYMWQRTS